jgi:outer membrane receptor protein involved in Fe transport
MFMLSGISAFGQSTTEGAIGGTVVDPQGNVVAGAPVVVKNLGTNLTTSVKTDAQGFYRVGQLEPATYSVTVKAIGFAPFRAENVIVTVGSLTAVSPHLTIGTTEQVDVSAEAPLINVTSADFAPTLNETAIENLPINGGRWSSFVLLTPGVVSDSNGFGLVSFRGMSTLLNNVTVDGADNNQAYFSEERGRTRAGYSTAKVAVQEFQVNTSNYSAEYGRSAGGVINTVTKSGTNQVHGEAFWYDRDNSWGTYNPFTTLTSYNSATEVATTAPYKPVDVRKMGGLGIGGPIVKDKLFWFFGYDRYHHNFPGTAVPNSATSFFAVPQAMSTFATGYCGSITSGANLPACQLASELAYQSTSATNMAKITQTQYNAAQAKYINALFGNGQQLGLSSITGPTPRTGDQDIFFPKLDWNLDQKNHASFEVNRMRWWSPAGIQTQATNAYGTNSFGNDYVKDTWGVVKFDTLITNSVSNQVRVQVGRDFEFEYNQQPSAYENQTLVNPVNPATLVATGYANPYGLPPNVNVGNFQFGTPLFLNRKAYPDEYKTQIADTITISRHQHNIRFGIDFMNANDKINNLYEQYGEFSYSGLPTYFAGLYDTAHKYYSTFYQEFQGTSVTTPVQTYRFSTDDWALFAQDDWKVSRRLTVNLGLRFETELYPSTYDNLLTSVQVGTQTVNPGSLPGNQKNWGPRVGFAWDTFGDGKTVLRGGYGMYFGRVINSTLFTGMTTTGSPNGQNSYSIKASNSASPSFPDILTTAPSASGTLSLDYFDPKFKMPQIHEIDLTLQRQLPGKMVLSVSYLGSFGRHLAQFNDVNLAAPGTPYCASSSGAQVALVNGACPAADKMLTPPSSVSYTLNNGTVTGLPLSSLPAKALTLPYYTSRLNYNYGTITDIFSGTNSSYNALAVQLEKRLNRHVQFAANYTWSHALDYGMNNTTGAGSSNFIDPLHPRFGMYGDSLTNVPNRFTFSSIIQAPWQHKGWLKYATDGWQVSPVLQMQNGLGNSLQTASSYPTQYVGTQEFQSVSSGMTGAGGSWQIPGTERNGFRQPNTYVFDMRFSKQFPVYEQYKLEFSADGFNLFNHRNVTGVSTTSAYTISSPSSGTAGTTTAPTIIPYSSAVATNGSTEFNVPSSANSNYVYGVRQIQQGLRLTF